MKRVILAIMLLSLFSVANAAKPLMFPYGFGWAGEIACDGFAIADEGSINFEAKVFFDNDGNWIRTQEHAEVFQEFYRTDDPDGNHLSSSGHVNNRIEWNKKYEDVTFTQAGLVMHLNHNIPGYGPVFLEVGRIVYSGDWSAIYFMSSSRHALNDGTFEEALCDYFD